MRRRQLTPNRTAILRSIPLFQTCTERELEQVDGLVDDVELRPGEVLTREDCYEPHSYVIVHGEADVRRGGVHLATLEAGDFVGEMAMLYGVSRAATVTALTPMHLLAVDGPHFARLLDVGGVARAMLQGLVKRLRRADERLVEAPGASAAACNGRATKP